MTRIAFVGAGSAEFTRQLLHDLLSYDDLPTLDLVMHDIGPTRLRLAEQVASEHSSEYVAWQLADAIVEAHRDRLPPALSTPLALR